MYRAFQLTIVMIVAMLMVPGTLLAQNPRPATIFIPVQIDAPRHDPSNHTYWFGPFSETVSVADINGNGLLDIVAGRNWYEAPNWIKHSNFRDGAETNGPETESNAEFAMDVNGNGCMDIVTSGWMFMKGAYWYENPCDGDATSKWKSHRFYQGLNIEGVIPGDITGNGRPDVLLNHWSNVEGQGLTWFEHIEEPPYFIKHVIGNEGDMHGNGMGDVNGNGRMDIVTPVGWWEQPEDYRTQPWTFHADWRWEPSHGTGGSAAFPLTVYDVDGDGLNDVIISSAHAYGLAWYRQQIDANGNRTFERNWIETEYSQLHTQGWGDLTGDGNPNLVIGKRMFAHHGADIGAFEPLMAFWYEIEGGEFHRNILFYNHVPQYPDGDLAFNPPANTAANVGMKMVIADMNGDGRNDIVTSGKTGLYVWYNHGNPPTERHRFTLPAHESYPSWRHWNQYRILFNTEDLSGWKVPEGDGGHWRVVDGNISYDALSQAPGEKHLWTEEEFCDFDLHVEWRFPEASGIYDMPHIQPDGTYLTDAQGNVVRTPTPNSDSGILLRGTEQQANLWNWDVGSGELWGVRTDESLPAEIRAAAVPSRRMDNPIGEWNSMDVSMRGDRVSVMLNGVWVINDAQIPGIPECGPIGIQHHGGRLASGEMDPTSSIIDVRRVFVREVDPAEQADADVEDVEGWQTLFDGRDLSSWLTGPNNAWLVDDDGLLTLEREWDGAEHNLDYLWTEEIYGDFILELEFKNASNTNSGIFIRTPDRLDPVFTGIEVQVANSYDRPLSRGGTAGALYDLAAPIANPVNPPGEWNHMRVIARGPIIQVELNGERITEADLNLYTETGLNPDGSPNKFTQPLRDFARVGHIGLQDHGREVWYRNIRIKDLEPEFVTIFNARNLDGWLTGPNNAWLVDEHGILTLEREWDGAEHNHDYLWTEDTYGDFVLELEFNTVANTNSGIFIRTPDLMDPVYTGIEVQINNSYERDELHRRSTTGCLYDLVAPTKNTVRPPGEWNHMRVTAIDNMIWVDLNGERITEMDLDLWTETGRNPDGTDNKFTQPLRDFARVGHIGFQDHGREVWYRNIRLKSLDGAQPVIGGR